MIVLMKLKKRIAFVLESLIENLVLLRRVIRSILWFVLRL